jgi:site-specific DNA recombinase
MPPEGWICIPVPPLVDAALFAAVGDQLRENQRRAHIPVKGSHYLLQGVLVCAHCGYAYCGRTNDARNAYYRCSSSDTSRFGGTRLCYNKEVRLDQLDQAVWAEVCRLLEAPERLEQEYRARLQPPRDPDELRRVDAQTGKVRRGIARLIDGCASRSSAMVENVRCAWRTVPPGVERNWQACTSRLWTSSPQQQG